MLDYSDESMSLLFDLMSVSTFFLLSISFFYVVTYMYSTRSYVEYLPIMQKAIHLVQIVWVLALEYFTKEEDFQHITKFFSVSCQEI